MPVIGTARPEVKYLYVRDPLCKERVLTIGRVKKDEGQILAAYAVNKVTESFVVFRDHPQSKDPYVHDRFSKHIGREIVNHRLMDRTKRFDIGLPKGDKVRIVPAVLQFFADADETNAPYSRENDSIDRQISSIQELLGQGEYDESKACKDIKELEANRHLLIPHIVRDICKRALEFPAASSLSNPAVPPELFRAMVQAERMQQNQL